MRLPHHLKTASNGVFYFRLSIPVALRQQVGKTELVRSLGTRDPVAAKLLAYGLSAKYLAEFRHAMKKPPPSLLEAIEAARNGIPYTLTLPNGLTIQADGQEDHDRAIEAIGRLDQMGALKAQPAPSSQVAPAVAVHPIRLNEAGKKWLLHIKDKTKAKTLTIKETAVNDLEKFVGDKTLHNITRTDLAEFCQYLQNRELARPTISNKFIYLKGFFAAMIGMGHYPQGDNPADGQITYSKKDKRARKKFGSKPFADQELKTIFSPETYLKAKQPSEYWAPLMGLFTGARVNEICQLTLADFIEQEGFLCIRIDEEAEDQSTKNDSSKRLVPLHPVLMELGLPDYIKEIRSQGYERLFPNLQGSINGFGDAESKSFIRYLGRLNIKAETGRKGFHSFRSTVIQKLQSGKMAVHPEYRCQFVGHELKDEHFASYSRKYTPAELAAAIHPALEWNIDFNVLKIAVDHFNQRLKHTRQRRLRLASA